MGKYIRKNKFNKEPIPLMDITSPSSSFGVLTRAKSLALQRRLQKPSSPSSPHPPSPPNPPSKQKVTDSSSSYLQLRNRRLQKNPPIVVIRTSKPRKKTCGRNPNPNPKSQKSNSKSDSVAESAVNGENNKIPCVDTSLDLQNSERTTRESTPEINTSPDSSTKLNIGISDNNNQIEESFSGSRHRLPTTPEMDEFFSGAEQEQQKQFIEKYNFDPVNEQPLPGRYEWKKVDD